MTSGLPNSRLHNRRALADYQREAASNPDAAKGARGCAQVP